MNANVMSVIQAMAGAAEVPPKGAPHERRRPVITVSRAMGSGGNEIAQALAERLNVPHYTREILDAVAKKAEVTPNLISKLHERLSSASDSWLYSLMSGKNVRRDDYLHYLATTIRWLYTQGGVIVGRGGNIILAGRDVLRVRITGTLEACARRVALQEHLELAEAKRKVRESNETRGRFMWKMFRSRYSDATAFDVIVNTDHFGDYGHVVDILTQAVTSMGLDKPASGTTNK